MTSEERAEARQELEGRIRSLQIMVAAGPLPCPTLAEREIYDPESSVESWQEYIDEWSAEGAQEAQARLEKQLRAFRTCIAALDHLDRVPEPPR